MAKSRFWIVAACIVRLCGMAACASERCPPGAVEDARARCVYPPKMVMAGQPALPLQSADGGLPTAAPIGAACSSDFDCEQPILCGDPLTCQGIRKMVVCQASVCTVKGSVEDDSGCTKEQEADGCGLYRGVFCNGQERQTAPQCVQSCTSDADCDMMTACVRAACVPTAALQDGARCSDAVQCKSKHCGNGFCCAAGDCCQSAADCPRDVYSTSGRCDDPTTCQGSRGQAACMGNSCSMTMVDDDSGCSASTVARTCSSGPSVMCTGRVVQSSVGQCTAAPSGS